MTNQLDISVGLGLPALPSQSPDTIAALLWAREVLQKHLSTTYAVQDPKGVEELMPVKIGGVDQWLHIRGRNRKNPILLFIHGGPGTPMLGIMDAIQRPWEDYFTVVQWDQRQTGKSYYPADDERNPLHVEQFLEDTEEVIKHLCYHLDQERLFILGHSWGSVLGMHMVRRHPDLLHAYIGVGQVVTMMNGERLLYERLLSHAREQKDEQFVARLKAIAPYPNPETPEKSFAENCAFVRKELSRLAGETLMHHLCWDDAVKMLSLDRAISPHITLTDLSNTIIGDDAALLRPPYTSLTKDFLDIDLPKDIGSSFKVPIFFFSGAHDFQTPVTLSDQWFSKIKAPHKELLHFEESSHMVFSEEPGKFLTALVNRVLPLAAAESDRKVSNG